MKRDIHLYPSQFDGKSNNDYVTTNRSSQKEHIISPLGALFVLLAVVGFIAIHSLKGVYGHYLTTSYIIVCLAVLFKAFEYPVSRISKK